MSPKRFTMATIQRYSLLLSRTLNKWLAIRDTFFKNIHWSGYSAVWLLHGWCRVKLLPFGACSVDTIQPCLSFVSSHLKPHTPSTCVFSCHMPSALLAEWQGSFACYSSNIGVEWILKWVCTESWPWWRQLSCCSCRALNTFWSQVWCSTTELFSLPMHITISFETLIYVS